MTISNWRKILESPTQITYQNNKIQHLAIRVTKVMSKAGKNLKNSMWIVNKVDGYITYFIGERTNKKSAVSLAFEYMMENKK